MKKTILTTLAIAMTLNSAAFAADNKNVSQKQADRIVKVAAMTNEERQNYRQEVLDNIENYKQGLGLLNKRIAKANETRNEKSLASLYSALSALSTGAVAYLSSTRNVKVQTAGKVAGARLAAVAAVISTGFLAVNGTKAIKAQIDVNRLQVDIDKSIEELDLLQTEIQAIADLTPKE